MAATRRTAVVEWTLARWILGTLTSLLPTIMPAHLCLRGPFSLKLCTRAWSDNDDGVPSKASGVPPPALPLHAPAVHVLGVVDCRVDKLSSSQRRPLTEEETQLLMDATDMDRRLYAEALRIFKDRAAAHGCPLPAGLDATDGLGAGAT